MIEENFYNACSFAKRPPEGVHYEIEVLTDLRVMSPKGKHEKVHLHPSSKHVGHKFVCWTQKIGSQKKAFAVMELWAVGTTYTLENGPSFGALVNLPEGISHGEIGRTCRVLGLELGISIVELDLG